MSALIEQLTDYTHADTSVPILYKASQIDNGTLLSLDFRDGQCYASGSVPATVTNGQVLNNIIDGGGTLSLTTGVTNTITSAGLKFQATSGQYIDLGSIGKMATGATQFGFGGWVKGVDSSADPNAYSAIAGYMSSTAAANCQWVIQHPRASANYQGQVAGLVCNITLADGAVAHLFWVATIAGGTLTLQGYKNGTLVNTVSATLASMGLSQLPTPTAPSRIGQVQGYNQPCACELGSFDFEDFTVSGAAGITAFLAAAYGDNVGRFS